jgi:hypothetical protein
MTRHPSKYIYQDHKLIHRFFFDLSSNKKGSKSSLNVFRLYHQKTIINNN